MIKRLTEEQKISIAMLYEQGISPRKIAALFDILPTRVHHVREEFGLPARSESRSDATKRAAQARAQNKHHEAPLVFSLEPPAMSAKEQRIRALVADLLDEIFSESEDA